MPKIHAMLDIGKRSMMNSQAALQTVSHNIANKTTEGYSRQRVELQTAQPIQEGRLQFGMGTRASQVTRTNNPYLEKQMQQEKGELGYMDGRAAGMTRVEQVFNEQANKGLNQYMTDFFNSFRELANNPESATTRSMVKESAEALVGDFKRVNDQMNSIQRDIDQQIIAQTEEVNKMVKEISTLNKDIAQVEVQGLSANDQRDRRDLLLKKLNERIDIHYAEGNTGMVTVSTAGNAILVSGLDSHELEHRVDPATNQVELFYRSNESTPPFKISDRIKGGSIGGAIDIRDRVAPDIKNKIDQIAYSLAKEVNSAHVRGFDRSGRPGAEFFTMTGLGNDINGASVSIKLNSDIAGDVSRIAAGVKPGAVGDNTVANVISQIQHREIMDGATIDDFYNAQVGSVGVMAQRAIKSKEAQQNIVDQLSQIRESISGVSLDEEATKMIEFQKGFDASARVIRTADEMFDTILNLKRM